MCVNYTSKKKEKKEREGRKRKGGRQESEYPGGPVVGSWCFHCQGPGSVSGPAEELRSHKPGKAARVGEGRRAY